MPDSTNPPNQSNLPQVQQQPFPIELVAKFLDNQTEQIKLQHRELDIRAQSEGHQHEYAKELLHTQATDLKGQRDHIKGESSKTKLFAFGVVLVIATLICVLAYSGKETLATELIKAMVYISAGALGGAGYMRLKGPSSQEPKQN